MVSTSHVLLLALAEALPPALPRPGAPEGPFSTLGVTLRRPLDLPECAGDPDGRRYAHTAPSAPCFERESGMPAPGVAPTDETVTVRFPAPPRPAPVDRVFAYLHQGRPVRAWSYTPGAASQERDLAALVEAFGAPRTLHRTTLPTPGGGALPTISARWSLPAKVSVTFLGTNGRSSQGMAIIDTPEGAQAFREHIDAIAGTRAAP